MKNVRIGGRINLLFLVVIASMFFAALAFTEEMQEVGEMEEISAEETSMETTDPQFTMAGIDIPAEDLLGMKVVNNAGEDIGKIKEAKADQSSGRVNFVIIAKKGVMGLIGSQYAVPIKALTVSPDAKQATLNVDESLLASAPKKAREMSDVAFQLQLEQHYGIAPAWEAEPEFELEQYSPEQGEPSPSQEMMD